MTIQELKKDIDYLKRILKRILDEEIEDGETFLIECVALMRNIEAYGFSETEAFGFLDDEEVEYYYYKLLEEV